MNVDVIKSYLVSLGFEVDHSQMRKFESALRNAGGQVTAFTTGAGGVIEKFTKAGAVIGSVLTAITAATVGLMDNVSQSDLEMQVWARRMYMSTDAARSLKTATDALGYSLEDIIFGPRELQERFAQLIEDQKRLQQDLGPDFEKQMRRIRDVRFEFTRLGVEIQYLSMDVVKELSKGLFGDEDSLENKLKQLNEYLIQHLPDISKMIAGELVPVIKDMGAVAKDLYSILKQVDWKGIADDITVVVHALRSFFDFLASHPLAQQLLKNAGKDALMPGLGEFSWLWDKFKPKQEENSPGQLKLQSDSLSDVRKSIQEMIVTQAKMMGVDPNLALAVAKQESGQREYDKNGKVITSPVGAMGVFQLMPDTAKSLGVDATNTNQNIYGGVRYLRDLLQKHHGDIDSVLKEYGGFVKTDPSAYINSVRGMYQPMSLDLSGMQIHITEPKATPEQIRQSVEKAINNATDKRTQRNLVQMAGPYS